MIPKDVHVLMLRTCDYVAYMTKKLCKCDLGYGPWDEPLQSTSVPIW